MTQSELEAELEAELVAEGKSFKDKYQRKTPHPRSSQDDKDFISSITKAFNRDAPYTLSESDAAKNFAIMHGYLESAYIFGMAEDDEPEWADSRETSWRRWVQYLKVVEFNDSRVPGTAAQLFAMTFFYAVDSVAPYT